MRSIHILLLVVLIPAAHAQDASVDHSLFHELLQKYVDQDGNVDYETWKKTDSRNLNRYLARMGGVDAGSLGRDERMAYWINVYNALTIRGMLEFYPLKSIKEKVSRLGGFNIWDDYPVLLKGEEYSLNHIEHKILRKMGDPRIHFAIVCASKGCPRLRSEAYTGSSLNGQLEDNARDFFSRAQNFRVDAAKSALYLSSILKWFGEDFGKNDTEVLREISQWIQDPAAKSLAERGAKVRYLDYDWSLNKQ